MSAIATTSCIPGDGADEKFRFIRDGLSRFAGRPLAIDREVYESEAATNLRNGARGATLGELVRKPIRPIDEVESQFYLTVDVADRPGVLAAIAGVFGRHGVSIQSMHQQGQGSEARIIFVTHLAPEAALAATVHEVRELDTVERVGSILRVIGGAA